MDGQARVSVYLELKNRLKTGLDQAKQYLNKNVQEFKQRLNDLKTSHIQAFNSMREEVPLFGRAMQVLGNPYVLVTAGIMGLTAALGSAGNFAATFDEAMAKANVTAQKSPVELAKVKEQLLNIASNSNVKDAVMKTPEAYNILLSSGMNEKVAINTVDPTLRASKAGRTDIKTTADTLSNTMNATGITDATKVLDVLFATLNKGKAEFVDVANYLPKIIPGADAVGASFEQTAGAFAFLTANGLKAEAASVGLQNVFKAFKETKIKDNLAEIGVNVFDAQGKFSGLTNIVESLRSKLSGMTDEQRAAKLDQLGLDVEASTSLGIMVKNYSTLDPMLKAVTNSQGEFNKAQEFGATKLDGWNLLVNKAQTAWLQLGDVVLNGFSIAINWVIANGGTIISILADLGILALIAAGAWGLFTIAINANAIWLGISTTAITIWSTVTNLAAMKTAILEGAIWLLNIAMSANPVGLVVAAIAALVAGFVLAYRHSEKFRAVLSGLMAVASLVGDVFVGLGKTIIGAFTLDAGMIKEGLMQGATAVASIMDGGIGKAFDKGYNNSMAESAAKAAAEEIEKNKSQAPASLINPAIKPTNPVISNDKSLANRKDKPQAAMTGSSNTKVININKVSMIDGNFISNNAELAAMSPKELERFFEELFQRMSINMARSYAN